MRNFKLTLSYDGTDFHGWQRQPGLPTIQGELQSVVGQITGEDLVINAAGRTDAGVHALGQVANLTTTSARLSPQALQRAINALMRYEIRVLDAQEVPLDFHATLSARSKRYRYIIDNRRAFADPFRLRYAWHVRHKLDVEAMRRAGQALIGTHDFRSFETDYPNRATSVRTLYDLAVTRHEETVTIEVEADGFLYNMVRCIAGTLTLVGGGNRQESWVADTLRAQNRVAAGANAPPHGLYLLHVNYDHPPPARPTDTPSR